VVKRLNSKSKLLNRIKPNKEVSANVVRRLLRKLSWRRLINGTKMSARSEVSPQFSKSKLIRSDCEVKGCSSSTSEGVFERYKVLRLVRGKNCTLIEPRLVLWRPNVSKEVIPSNANPCREVRGL